MRYLVECRGTKEFENKIREKIDNENVPICLLPFLLLLLLMTKSTKRTYLS
jgi:hypothetical protein